MDALELMARLGGEILNNKIRATVDGEIVILARLQGTEWEYTDKGQELANLHSNLAVDEAAAATKPARKKATPAVESGDTPAVEATEAAAETQAPAAE